MQEKVLVTKKEVVNHLVKHKVLVTVDVLEKLSTPGVCEQVMDININPAVFTKQLDEVINKLSGFSSEEGKVRSSLQIIFNYKDKMKKKNLQGFVQYFIKRYYAISTMLQQRQEMKGVTSINRVITKQPREMVSIIGMVSEKFETKTGKIMLTVEDPSGNIKVLINNTNPELLAQGKDIMLDEIIGIIGVTGNNIVFTNKIIYPDVPISNELKKAEDEVYAVVLTDVHVGSSYFLEEEFEEFIQWVRGEAGTPEQKKIAEKIGYIFMVGDMVDGIGIYPQQEEELTIKDIYEQYHIFTNYMKRLPSHIPIIICAGNHDAVRLAEPQPVLDKQFTKELWDMPNVYIISNPGIVNIHAKDTFPGFNVLLYHGYSYDFYADQVPSIKNSGKHISDRSVSVMKYLLQRRHLAPSYTSNLFIPDDEQDCLVIDKVPDIFLSGHIHKASAGQYKGVSLVTGSCFQAKTLFQEKVGHEPEPCQVPVINLQTRKVTILSFGGD